MERVIIGRRYAVESMLPVEVAPGCHLVWLLEANGSTTEFDEPGALIEVMRHRAGPDQYTFWLITPKSEKRIELTVNADQNIDACFDNGTWPLRVWLWLWFNVAFVAFVVWRAVRWVGRKVRSAFWSMVEFFKSMPDRIGL